MADFTHHRGESLPKQNKVLACAHIYTLLSYSPRIMHTVIGPAVPPPSPPVVSSIAQAFPARWGPAYLTSYGREEITPPLQQQQT